MRLLKYFLALVVLVLAGIGGFFGWAARVPEIAPIAAPEPSSFSDNVVQQGEMLATIGDCVVCHTKTGGQEFAGGLALPTPFGTIYSTNITPDVETGIGGWSEEAFRRAMHEGIDRGGNYLYPAFPYDHFTKVTDEDIGAIYAYLMSQPAVSSPAVANELPFPFNIRLLMAGWNFLFLDKGRFEPDPQQNEEWNRGAYLVEGLGHCGACHSPRNALGAVDKGNAFGGGEAEGWHVPALNANSPSPTGWTADAMVNYLIDGWDEDHGIAAGPMTPVANAFANASEDDVYAIAAYIRSFMGEQSEEKANAARSFAEEREFTTASQSSDSTASGRGEAIFARVCANCHRQGSQNAPLALSSTVAGPDPRNIIHIVMNGITPPEGSPDRTMPRFGQTLSDEEIADLVAFVRQRFTDKPAWSDVPARIQEIRALGG